MRNPLRTLGRGLLQAEKYVFPRWAARRAHERRLAESDEYRLLWQAVCNGSRGYRGAKGAATPWLGSGGSADAEISCDLPTLRNHSRELNRDDPIASGLTNTFTDNVVMTGLRPQARTGDKIKNEKLEDVWARHKDHLCRADDLSHAEHQIMLVTKWLEDGDVITHACKRRPDEPVWFEVVEADRLITPMSPKGLPDGHEIRDGVERDADGVPVAYWVLPSHPGDTLLPPGTSTPRLTTQPQRIPAAACRHLKLTTRPGQTRGVPLFHAILQDLRDLDLLLLAGLKRSQIAACLSVFLKTQAPIESPLSGETSNRHGMLDQQIEPGMMFQLMPGEDIETLLPNFPTPEFGPFIVTLARRIGAALGVSWQIVLKDFSESNYSSARTDLLECRATYLRKRMIFSTRQLAWEWRVVMEDALLRGELTGVTLADITKVRWIADGWKWVDPVKEVLGLKHEIAMGLVTFREACETKGVDWVETLEQLAEEDKLRIKLGLKPLHTELIQVAELEVAADEPDEPAAKTTKKAA